MALNNLLQAVVCLVLGAVAGYSLRSPQQAAGASSPNAAALRGGAQAAATNASERPADAKGGDAASAKASMGERMKDLLERYNSDVAKRELGGLAEPDIRSALAVVAGLPKSRDRDSLRANLYRAWAKLNPSAAWNAALADPLDTNNSNLGAVAGEIAKKNPDSAISLALSLGMGNKRTSVLQSIFTDWGKEDPAGAVAYLNKHPELPTTYWSIGSALGDMVEKDPRQAAALALSLVDQQTRGSCIYTVMRQWAERDPKAALAWAQNLDNVALRQEAMSNALSGWVGKDPKAAMDAAQAIQDPTIRAAAMQGAWYTWFQKDPAGAMAYSQVTNDEQMLQQIRWNFGYSVEGLTPQETNSLLTKLPEGEAKQDILRSLASAQIYKGRFNQAIELLNTMPDSQNRDYTLQQLGKRWGESDPSAAAAWLKLQPDSSDRDLAAAGYASALARSDPRAAMEWADTIPDEGVKSGAAKNILMRWLTNDPAGAEAWLKTSGWSDSDKQDLRQNAQKSGPDRYGYGVTVKNRR